MTRAVARQPLPPPPDLFTVADLMRPPLTTDTNDHAAAATYVMKHAGATGLMVLDAVTGQPRGILTEADIVRAVADGKDLNNLRIHKLMTIRPTVINLGTSVRDAARFMTRGHFRHLPVTGDSGLVGIIDIVDVCRALIDPSRLPAAQRGGGPGPGRWCPALAPGRSERSTLAVEPCAAQPPSQTFVLPRAVAEVSALMMWPAR